MEPTLKFQDHSSVVGKIIIVMVEDVHWCSNGEFLSRSHAVIPHVRAKFIMPYSHMKDIPSTQSHELIHWQTQVRLSDNHFTIQQWRAIPFAHGYFRTTDKLRSGFWSSGVGFGIVWTNKIHVTSIPKIAERICAVSLTE